MDARRAYVSQPLPLLLKAAVGALFLAAFALGAPRGAPPTVDRAALQDALALTRLMRTEGACGRPRARVTYVSEVLPGALKRYSPPAALLHVCEPSSGCCFSETETCQPKTIEKVRSIIDNDKD